MPNSNYRKGRAREWKTCKLLEAAGYTAARTAGSHGEFDVLAFNEHGFRLIQVKAGSANITPAEREFLRDLHRPENASVEVWRWKDRIREPLIERIA